MAETGSVLADLENLDTDSVGSWSRAPSRHSRGTHFVTDLEGRADSLKALLAAGTLRFVGGRLDFGHSEDPAEKLVFGGDLSDRGTDSIKLVEWLTDLKKKHPERVFLLWGNRDLNKLGMLRALPLLEESVPPDFETWLLRKLGEIRSPETSLDAYNTLEHRVDYWLESHSAKGALDRHRQELGTLRGWELSLREAAQDYVERVQPGGVFFEYLRLGQVIYVDKNVLYVHGGLTDENIGVVPERTTRYRDPRRWMKELNRWGQQQLDEIERAVESRGTGLHVPSKLLDYGDAVWDPTAKVGTDCGVVFMNDQSVIYGFRQREGGGFRAPSDRVVRFLKRAGIDTEVVGHSPFGDVPGPLKEPGYLRIMADTSYSRPGAESTITVDPEGGVWILGRTTQGSRVTYRASARDDSPIGYITDDGYTVVGRSRVHGHTEYLLYKYYDGYQIAERLVTRSELDRLHPLPAIYEVSQEILRHRDLLLENLAKKGKRIHSLEDALNNLIGDKTPIVVSGASKFGQFPASPGRVERELRTLLRHLDPESVVILTGGTDLGVEETVHREARAAGILVIGFIHEGAIPGEIDLVDDVVLAGTRNQWSDPLMASLNVAKGKNGFALFVGGGGVVKEGIDFAERAEIHYLLWRQDPERDCTGGASGEAARARPGRAFGTAKELRALVESSGFGVFRVPGEIYHGRFGPESLDLSPKLMTEVISGAQKFIIPVPRFDGGGEPLVYPQDHESAGQPITDWKGKPIGDTGVVFFNAKDQAVQAVKDDGQGVIIINQVSKEQAELLLERIGGSPERMGLCQLKKLLEFAQTHLGLSDMYNSDREFIASKMSPLESLRTGVTAYGLHRRDERNVVFALYVEGRGEFEGPAAGAQKFDDGAVIVKQGDSVRLIQPDVFVETYRLKDGSRVELEELKTHTPQSQFEPRLSR